jgi:hypothetical protein
VENAPEFSSSDEQARMALVIVDVVVDGMNIEGQDKRSSLLAFSKEEVEPR